MLLFPESRNLSQQNTHTRDKEEEIKTKQKIQDAEAGIGSKIKGVPSTYLFYGGTVEMGYANVIIFSIHKYNS